MPMLPDFRLERHFSRWEFRVRHHLTASDAESMSLRDLLDMADPATRAGFEDLWLGYTQTHGAPDLRAAIAGTYAAQEPDNVLCFAGASEGIFAAMHALLEADSHAIVITPNYQSHETLPLSICAVTGVPLDPEDGWSLDIDRVAAAIRPETRLLVMNFPHNPTGAILPLERYEALIALCRRHGIHILHDEIFHGLGPSGAVHLPFVADRYERGLSLGVMSKAYGLPGLRIGWIATQDRDLLDRMERLKHYLSICNAAPSERLAIIALDNRERILARNCALVDRNIMLWEAFFSRHGDLFEWRRPEGSCMAFPRYTGPDGVEHFTGGLVEEAGVLLLPGSVYASDLGQTPREHFRIGLGRRGLEEGLEAIDRHLERRRP